MATPLSPSGFLKALCLPALLALAGALGCVDHNPTGTTLYVYDNNTSSVQIWADVNKVYDAAKASSGIVTAVPDRAIQSTVLSSANFDLAWGGLAVDSNRQMLYLVSEKGVVYAITKANTQNGSISNNTDIFSYNLGSSADGFPTSVFGQATVDTSSNILYVMQTSTDGSATRVWKVPNPNQFNLTFQSPLPAANFTIGVSSDTFGTGVAVGSSGTIFGLFGGGSTIYSILGASSNGPRLRQGLNGTFPPSIPVGTNLLIGPTTQLANPLTIGSLGYDTQNNLLYVFSGPNLGSLPLVVAFTQNQFGKGTFDQLPAMSLPDTAATLGGTLRIISHPPNSDWMLGADYTAPAQGATGTGTGQSTLVFWKSPSTGAAAVPATMPGGLDIRGMAIGGTD